MTALPRLWLLALTVCGCVGSTPRAALPSLVQNNTGDAELTVLASDALMQQLHINRIEASRFELNARLEALSEGGLQIQILCSRRSDHLLLAHVQVKGRGAPSHRLIASLVAQAARELAVDCR